MTLPLRVIIVGAGVSGLATAYGLAYSKHADKFHIQVLECREPFGGEVGQGQHGYPIRLSKPGRKALSSLLTPLDASLISDAHAKLPLSHDGLTTTHDAGKPAFSGRFAPYGRSSMIERGDLVRVLKEALDGRGVVVVEYGRKVTGVEVGEEEGWLKVQRGWSKIIGGMKKKGKGQGEGEGEGKGDGGRKEGRGVVLMTDKGEIPCDFVVGADGMHSTIRNALYPNHTAQARTLHKVARNYRLSSLAIWDHVADKEGINVVLSGKTEIKWTATLIPTVPYRGNGRADGSGDGNGDSGEVYCVFTTGEEVGEGLDGCVGAFVDALKQDPGFAAENGVGDDHGESVHSRIDVAGEHAPDTREGEMKRDGTKGHTRLNHRNVSISVQSTLSTSTDCSTRPLISSPLSATSRETAEAVEDEPTSLIEALRASQNPRTPIRAAPAGAQEGTRGFSAIHEDAEGETSNVVDPADQLASPEARTGPAHDREHNVMQEDVPLPISTAPSVYTAPLYACNRIYTGTPQVAIIGDAAHGMTPFAGTGASLALRDAEDLVRVLEKRVEIMLRLDQADHNSGRDEEVKQQTREEKVLSGVFDRVKLGRGMGRKRARTPHRAVEPGLDGFQGTDKEPVPRHRGKTPQKSNTEQKQAEEAMRKDMYLFNIRMKRHADPAIVASRGSLWLAMGESALARGARGVVFGLGRAMRAGRAGGEDGPM